MIIWFGGDRWDCEETLSIVEWHVALCSNVKIICVQHAYPYNYSLSVGVQLFMINIKLPMDGPSCILLSINVHYMSSNVWNNQVHYVPKLMGLEVINCKGAQKYQAPRGCILNGAY